MVNVEDPSAFTWTGKALLREPSCPDAISFSWVGSSVWALKEASCTVGNNIIHSLHHKLLLCFFIIILEFSLLERALTRNISFLSLQTRMVVNSLVGENSLLFLPACSFPQFESFSWFNCWPYSCSNISFFKVGDEDKAMHPFLSLVSILTWWSHFYQI